MRPMLHAVDNVIGAFSPHSGAKSVDTVHRESTDVMLVRSIRGDGTPSPADGTFIDLAGTKYGVNRFFKTAPAPVFELRPILPGYRQQVQTPTFNTKLPGYTSNVNVVQTAIGRALNKPYQGQSY